MRPFFVLAICCLTQIGCGSSYTVSSVPDRKHLSFEQFNAEAGDGGADVVLQDGSRVNVLAVRAEPQSTSWQLSKTSERVAVPTSTIRTVTFTNRALGGAEGAGIGFLSGAALGFLVAIPVVSANSQDEMIEMAYIVLPAGGSVAGLFIGVITGIVSGHTYEYEFESASVQPTE